jgi:tetratricopeptide (TPR) repeat protein
MNAVSLPGISRAVDEAKHLLDRGERVVALTGGWGSGKSTALEKLATCLPARRVLRVSMPVRGDDIAAVALASIAIQLASVDRELPELVTSPGQPWRTKLERLVHVLDSPPAKDCVMLLDNPKLEQPPGGPATLFGRHAVELSGALLRTKGSVVFAQSAVPRSVAQFLAVSTVAVQSESVPSEVLRSDLWNGLGGYAQELLSSGEKALAGYSPLELRLAVALCATGVKASVIVEEHFRRRELVTRLLEAPAEGMAAALRRVMGRLAVLRVPFSKDFLNAVGVAELDSLSRTILMRAFLFGDDQGLRLHEFLAHEALARDWLDADGLAEAHRKAAQWHEEQFSRLAPLASIEDPAEIRHEMEAIHHLTEAGDPGVLDRRLFFADQYDALGKSLSLKRLYDVSAKAYRRALELDADDWYAHHYLAYNLDIPGHAPDDVEREYRRALELIPNHPWYHRRYVCFLLTRGHTAAARAAWNDALAVLTPEGATDPQLFSDLHRHVARLLLYFGQLDFARQVLDEVPPRFRSDTDWHAAFCLFLTSQQEAERDELVFPPNVPLEQRWEGPHLLRDPSDRPRVLAWHPGRIVSIDGGIHIRTASKEGRFGWRDLTKAEFIARSRLAGEFSIPAGTFVEVVTLRIKGNKRTERILTHERPRVPAALCGEPFPPPNRYVSAAAADHA